MAKEGATGYAKGGGVELRGKTKAKHFAGGGLARTQSNLASMGRGLAKVENQRTGGNMKKGGKVKMKKGGAC